ncbi:hypothetical protein AB3K78_02510 [Leucobacter sp. HNU]|uniref:hypothetical protein n=1 Tax=Leucobacter sp. HNU TaxID=3236805 RepID=UPI003A80606A
MVEPGDEAPVRLALLLRARREALFLASAERRAHPEARPDAGGDQRARHDENGRERDRDLERTVHPGQDHRAGREAAEQERRADRDERGDANAAHRCTTRPQKR